MTDEEIAKIYGVSVPKPTMGSGSKDAEIAKIYGVESGLPSPSQARLDTLKAGLKAFGKVMDYPGGLARTAVAYSPVGQIAAMVRGKGPSTPIQDLKRAVTGDAPTTKEYGSRYGVDLPTPVAVAGDVASGIAGQSLLGSGLKTVGRGIYNRAFKRADAALAQDGKLPLSQILWERGKTPLSKADVESRISELIPKIVDERKVIEAPLLQSQATTSIDDVLSSAQKNVDELSKSGAATDRALVEKLQKYIDEQKLVSSSPTYKELQDIRRATGKSVNFKDTNDTENTFWKLFGGGAKNESQKLASTISPELAEQIALKNSQVSSLLSSLPRAEREALVAAGKGDITQIDALLMATRPDLYVAKNIGKVMGTVGGQTVTGRGLHLGGRALSATAPYTPWLGIAKEIGVNNE